MAVKTPRLNYTHLISKNLDYTSKKHVQTKKMRYGYYFSASVPPKKNCFAGS